MTDDKTTIGLTQENKQVMQEVMPYFNEQLHAAKFAMALAIEEGVTPGRAENTETVWNTGSFDPDGQLRDLLKALYGEIDQPYVAIEYFINRGFRLLEDHLTEKKELDIPDLI